jgi:hypothetical protein
MSPPPVKSVTRMLRGNLSSRPFYNERLVSAALVAVALLVVALTGFNGYKVYELSKQRSALKGRIDHDKAQAQEIERGALALQRSVNKETLAQLAYSTQEANALIDERTFSWTTFFGLIEKTMPMDLRIVGVAPRIERGEIKVTMTVVGRRPDDVEAFADALQDSGGAFYDVLPSVTDRNEDDNTYRADVVAFYLPPNQSVPRSSSAKPGAKPAGRGRQ